MCSLDKFIVDKWCPRIDGDMTSSHRARKNLITGTIEE
jgi:hypothetical protein